MSQCASGVHLRLYKDVNREETHKNTSGVTTSEETAPNPCLMANPLRSWVMLGALVVCVLLCWSSLADAYPPKPQAPGKNGTKEDWEKYRLDLTRYVNLITRQRYGKRATVEQVLGRLLYGADSSQDTEPRSVDYSDEWNTSPDFP